MIYKSIYLYQLKFLWPPWTETPREACSQTIIHIVVYFMTIISLLLLLHKNSCSTGQYFVTEILKKWKLFPNFSEFYVFFLLNFTILTKIFTSLFFCIKWLNLCKFVSGYSPVSSSYSYRIAQNWLAKLPGNLCRNSLQL